MTRGVCYIATREPYLSEAEHSAESIRAHHPEMPITLYAPADVPHPPIFDSAETIADPSHNFSDSNLTSQHVPYDRTLFLDTDTYVAAPLDAVFDMLDRFDIAAAQDPAREGTAPHEHEHDVPATFPQYNTGVVAYRDTAGVRDLFDRWNELYHTVDGVAYGLNQPTFRMAAYESDLDIGTLPAEYNFRIGNVANKVNYACGPVVILHGRSAWWDIEQLAERLNETHERRVVIVKSGSIQVITNDERTTAQSAGYWLDRMHWKYQKAGTRGIAGYALGRVRAVLT